MWIVLALGTAFLTSFNPILYKRMLKNTDSLVVVWGVSLLALPLLALFTFALTPRIPKTDIFFVLGIVGSAALNVIAQLSSTRALKLADVSLVTPLLTFSPVFTVMIAAVFLNEIPSAQGLVGVGLILIGAYWLTRNANASWLVPFNALAFTPPILLVLLAGLLWAITPLFEKPANLHTNPESPRLVAFTANALLTLLLTPSAITQGRSSIARLFHYRRELLLAGLIAGVAPILGHTAFSLGFVGYVTTLFKLSTLMTVIWSFLFFKESGIQQRLPASIIMVIGTILIVS